MPDSILQSLLEEIGIPELRYDHGDKSFSVGGTRVAIEVAYRDSNILLDAGMEKATHPDERLLASSMFGPIMFPRMYDWLNGHFGSELTNDTTNVMREVYASLDSRITVEKLPADSLWGFHMGRLRYEHPHATFSVLGNCACMGVAVQGFIGEQEWQEKFASYDFHNIDSPQQRISLLAGIGHVAYLASLPDEETQRFETTE